MPEPERPLMVLIAGPYRSGTGDDPALIARNMQALDEAALAVFRAGHLPVAGEWFALPLIRTAGPAAMGDATWDAIFHPVAERVAARCDRLLADRGCIGRGGHYGRDLRARGPASVPPGRGTARRFQRRCMTEQRVRVRETRVLSDDWYVLRKTTFDYRRRDGTWQTLSRETYDRGNGAAILPYDRSRGTVLLTRQFRYPAYVNGHPEPLIEAIAGLLDQRSPEEAIRHEAEEEAGCRVAQPRRVFEAFVSPGSVTERLVFFVAEYSAADRVAAGGGVQAEGEDIEVLEPTLDEALAMVASGEIADGKTIMLLQYAKLHRLVD